MKAADGTMTTGGHGHKTAQTLCCGAVCVLLPLLAACAPLYSTPPSIVHQPMTARPQTYTQPVVANGTIYQSAYGRPLFEDRRARQIGDTITINLTENTSARKNANASAERSSSLSGGINALDHLPFRGLRQINADAGIDSSFGGSGSAVANNAFNGTITVTVTEVLPNGNLLVSGEKQLAINQGNEFIRFSGVINRDNISPQNTVQSIQVADARMEYVGNGYIDEAQRIGWLHRFFNIIMPF